MWLYIDNNIGESGLSVLINAIGKMPLLNAAYFDGMNCAPYQYYELIGNNVDAAWLSALIIIEKKSKINRNVVDTILKSGDVSLSL